MIAKIKFKETFSDHVMETSYICEVLTREEVVKFFGLNEPDIEWYEIEIK